MRRRTRWSFTNSVPFFRIRLLLSSRIVVDTCNTAATVCHQRVHHAAYGWALIPTTPICQGITENAPVCDRDWKWSLGWTSWYRLSLSHSLCHCRFLLPSRSSSSSVGYTFNKRCSVCGKTQSCGSSSCLGGGRQLNVPGYPYQILWPLWSVAEYDSRCLLLLFLLAPFVVTSIVFVIFFYVPFEISFVTSVD